MNRLHNKLHYSSQKIPRKKNLKKTGTKKYTTHAFPDQNPNSLNSHASTTPPRFHLDPSPAHESSSRMRTASPYAGTLATTALRANAHTNTEARANTRISDSRLTSLLPRARALLLANTVGNTYIGKADGRRLSGRLIAAVTLVSRALFHVVSTARNYIVQSRRDFDSAAKAAVAALH